MDSITYNLQFIVHIIIFHDRGKRIQLVQCQKNRGCQQKEIDTLKFDKMESMFYRILVCEVRYSIGTLTTFFTIRKMQNLLFLHSY